MEKLEIKESFELEIKRLYLPLAIDVICPNCGKSIKIDLDDNYLSYPVVNNKYSLYNYCNHCNNDFSMDVYLKMNLIIDRKSLSAE